MKKEKKKFIKSLFYPSIFVLLLWIIKICENYYQMNLSVLGIQPKQLTGLLGIITGPLVHSDYGHLTNNTFPLLILGTTVFYFYHEIAGKVALLSIIITGIWVWAGARDAYHIGASGIVYSFASFLFFSGIIRRYPALTAISLLVIFLYGSLIWGIFPYIPHVSWESHLSGGIAGLVIAIYYKDFGPQRKRYEWELEEEEEEEDDIYYDGFEDDPEISGGEETSSRQT